MQSLFLQHTAVRHWNIWLASHKPQFPGLSPLFRPTLVSFLENSVVEATPASSKATPTTEANFFDRIAISFEMLSPSRAVTAALPVMTVCSSRSPTTAAPGGDCLATHCARRSLTNHFSGPRRSREICHRPQAARVRPLNAVERSLVAVPATVVECELIRHVRIGLPSTSALGRPVSCLMGDAGKSSNGAVKPGGGR